MGKLSFLLPDTLSPAARACLAEAGVAGGYDHTPVPTRRFLEDNRLVLIRDGNESGYLMTPWPVGDGTPIVLSSTLRERPEPYDLVTELARGKLNAVRTQTAEWVHAGFEPGAAEVAGLAAATKRFAAAVLNPGTAAAAAAADRIIADAAALGDALTKQFAAQVARTRLAADGPLPVAFGGRFAAVPDLPPDRLAAAFHAVRLVPSWKAIEPTEAGCQWDAFDRLVDWAAAAGLEVSVGPLVDLTADAFPDWLDKWDGDFPSFAAFTCDFVETVITRYRDRVGHWQVFAGFNAADRFGLFEDDRLRLAARLLESARVTAPDAAFTAGLSQPWGDYLTAEDLTYSPLVFADTLLRGGYSFAGLELDLTVGPPPRHSRPRDLLDVIRLLEMFAILGVPLEVLVGNVPAAPGAAVRGPRPGWASEVAAVAAAVPQVRMVNWVGPPTDAAADVPATFAELRAAFARPA